MGRGDIVLVGHVRDSPFMRVFTDLEFSDKSLNNRTRYAVEDEFVLRAAQTKPIEQTEQSPFLGFSLHRYTPSLLGASLSSLVPRFHHRCSLSSSKRVCLLPFTCTSIVTVISLRERAGGTCHAVVVV